MRRDGLFEVNIKYDNVPICRGKMNKNVFKDLMEDLREKFG